jgi:hypothetical protein
VETLSDLREIRVTKRRVPEAPWKVMLTGRVGNQTIRSHGTGRTVEEAKKVALARQKHYEKALKGRLGYDVRTEDAEGSETS